MAKIQLKSNGSPLTRLRVAKHFPTPSLAKQSFKEECDINNIMRKFEKQGLVDHLNTHKGDYGDFIGFQDYQSSLNQILSAQEAFMTIPSKIRFTFNNDPIEFLKFVHDPANEAEMVAMGLARERPTEVQEEPPTPIPPPWQPGGK